LRVSLDVAPVVIKEFSLDVDLPWARQTFAAASYLAEHGHPRTPEDLGAHECVIRTGVPNANRWTFDSRDGARHSVLVSGRIECNRLAAVNAAVAEGMGVGAGTPVRNGVEFASARRLYGSGIAHFAVP
jgi:DNA-binding transcriptional LysR family regulator